jgi:hypothetical protein
MDLLAVLEEIGATDRGWDAEGDDMLICPCGDTIELDGRCPAGHVSPLRRAGLI